MVKIKKDSGDYKNVHNNKSKSQALQGVVVLAGIQTGYCYR